MDTPYRRFGSSCFSCLPRTNEDEHDAINVGELIQVLNMKLQGIRYQMNEQHVLAQKYAKQDDMIRGRVELELYHFKKSQYEQLVGLYRRAKMIQDTISHTQSVAAIGKTMKRESKTMALLQENFGEIDELILEWDSIVQQTHDASKQLSVQAADDELEELKHIELSFNLPNVPTDIPEITNTRENPPCLPVPT